MKLHANTVSSLLAEGKRHNGQYRSSEKKMRFIAAISNKIMIPKHKDSLLLDCTAQLLGQLIDLRLQQIQ